MEPRAAKPTVRFIDEYCQYYRSLFPEVRSFEAFKYLHVGLISDLKRKTLPAIARVVGLPNSQSLQQFLCESPWSASLFRQWRLQLILQILDGREVALVIDETGDRKKGNTTDYVKRQYIGNLGKVENGLVAVSAYGLLENITFPLSFAVYKPKERLKPSERYRTKPEIAAAMIETLCALGFQFNLVLADSLYGESSTTFVSILQKLELPYVLAIRSNHGVWLPQGQRVRLNRWRKYERTFSDGASETRYIREIIYGKRHLTRYWELTTDKETLPSASTWMVMTHLDSITYKEVGDLYGLRNWVEYGLKQSKNELGWADFRITHYVDIEKWWELVMSAYLMVALHTPPLRPQDRIPPELSNAPVVSKFTQHRDWDTGQGWKNWLNNLRIILRPWTSLKTLMPWLELFPIPQLEAGFKKLIALMNHFQGAMITKSVERSFSSA